MMMKIMTYQFIRYLLVGAQLGTAVQLMISGFLADYWGWESIFYVMGTLGIIWVAIYVFIGAASPQVSKMISEEEKLYIQSSLGHVGGHKVRYCTFSGYFE